MGGSVHHMEDDRICPVNTISYPMKELCIFHEYEIYPPKGSCIPTLCHGMTRHMTQYDTT